MRLSPLPQGHKLISAIRRFYPAQQAKQSKRFFFEKRGKIFCTFAAGVGHRPNLVMASPCEAIHLLRGTTLANAPEIKVFRYLSTSSHAEISMINAQNPKRPQRKVRHNRLLPSEDEPSHMGIPSVNSPEFAAEPHRQSAAIAASPHEKENQAFIGTAS